MATRRPPSDSDSPPFGIEDDQPHRQSRRAPTPVLGVDEVPASLGDLGELGKKVHKIEKVLVDVVGLDPGASSGRLGRVEDDMDKLKTEVTGLTTWRNAFSAKLSVFIAIGIAAGSTAAALLLHLIEKALAH